MTESRGMERCAEASSFSAFQKGGQVHVSAMGTHRTGGYKTLLTQAPMSVFPPQFILYHARPSGPVIQVFTPFTESASFTSREIVDQVVVADAHGRHEVRVEQK